MHRFMGDGKWRGPSRRLLLLGVGGGALGLRRDEKKKIESGVGKGAVGGRAFISRDGSTTAG